MTPIKTVCISPHNFLLDRVHSLLDTSGDKPLVYEPEVVCSFSLVIGWRILLKFERMSTTRFTVLKLVKRRSHEKFLCVKYYFHTVRFRDFYITKPLFIYLTPLPYLLQINI